MSSGVSWDYVSTALREHHAVGTLAEHRIEGNTLSIRLQVPTVRPVTVDRVALSACDSALWLFEHRSVDRITYTLDGGVTVGFNVERGGESARISRRRPDSYSSSTRSCPCRWTEW